MRNQPPPDRRLSAWPRCVPQLVRSARNVYAASASRQHSLEAADEVLERLEGRRRQEVVDEERAEAGDRRVELLKHLTRLLVGVERKAGTAEKALTVRPEARL